MKPLLLIQGPVSSRSGYGERTRDLVRAILKINSSNQRFDIKVADTLWGGCPPTGLSKDPSKDVELKSVILTEPLTQQPDVFIQVSVPNEFQRIGKQLNIGVTAGIETTICSPEWIAGCNRMDLILTSSEHSKNVFLHTKYNQVNPQTQQPMGELQVTKPVEVLMEGIDLVFDSTATIDLPDELPNFNFLFVGHWLPGELGHDRKDVGMLIKTFLHTFSAIKDKPGLIIKTGTTFSQIDKFDIISKINEIKRSLNIPESSLPKIYVVFGDLTRDEMFALYNHPRVKAHISFTKGEGYGRPFAEASLSGKPLIVPNWSGHIDFTPHAIKLAGQLQQIHPSAAWDKVLVPESSWFYVNYSYAAAVMKNVFSNYDTYLPSANMQKKFIIDNYSFKCMVDKLSSILDTYTQTVSSVDIPVMLPLTMPELPTTI